MEKEQIDELESALRALLKGEHSSLILSFNDGHAPNYMPVEDWVYGDSRSDEWVSEEERKKAVENNSVWALQWYPHTPVGFHRLLASSLSVLVATALEAEVE